MAPHRGGQLLAASILAQEARAWNVNGCAGILRRVITETSSPTKWLFANTDVVATAISLAKLAITRPHEYAKKQPTTSREVGTPVASPSANVFANVSATLGNWEDALLFIDPVRVGRKQTASGVFIAKLMSRDNVSQVARWAAGRGLRFCVPTAVSRIGMVGGAWETALQLAQRYESAGGERYTAGILVPYLSNGGRWDLAMRVFSDGLAQGAFLNHVLLENMVTSTALHGHWHSCLSIVACLDKCAAWSEIVSNSRSSKHTYECVMNVCPTWVEALNLLGTLRMQAQRPTVRLVSSAIDHCGKSDQWQAASLLFDYARSNGLLGDLSRASKEVLVRHFHSAAHWQKALEALHWIGEAGDASAREGSLASVELCSSTGQWEMALMLGGSLDTSHLPLSTYTSLLKSSSDGRQWDAAINIVRAMESNPEVSLSSSDACVALSAASGNWEASLSLFAHFSSLAPLVVIPPVGARLAMKACVTGGRWEEGILISEELSKSRLPFDNHTQRFGLWAAALVGSWKASLHHYTTIPPNMRIKRDKDLFAVAVSRANLDTQRLAVSMLKLGD